MIYFDSDDTISAFTQWCLSIDKNCVKEYDESVDVIGQLIVTHRNRCFLDQKLIPSSKIFITRLLEEDDCRVLTTISSEEKIGKFCTDISYEELYKQLEENKYKWFENYGIPKEKIIIIPSNIKKSSYCQPGDILYDDQWKNCIDWNNSGGCAIKIGNKYWDKI